LRRVVFVRRRILWVAAVAVLVATPAVIGLVALRGDDSSGEARRAAALVDEGAKGGGHQLTIDALTPANQAIDVLSWSWGVTNPGAQAMATGGTATATGKAQLSELNFVKKVDEVSPKLFLGAASGNDYTQAVLRLFNPSNGTEYMTVTLTNVYIASVQYGGNKDEIPTETVSLAFSKLTIATADETGTKVPPAAYDIRAQKS
jgi:type VI secretion system secreted protein Hcp